MAVRFKNKDRGLTLLEVLISMALFLSIVSSIYLLFGRATKANIFINDKIAIQEEAQKIAQAITTDLNNSEFIISASSEAFKFWGRRGQKINYFSSGGNVYRNEESLNDARTGAKLYFTYYDRYNELLHFYSGDVYKSEIEKIKLVNCRLSLKRGENSMETEFAVKLDN